MVDMSKEERDKLVAKLTFDVTYHHVEPYPELETALNTLICRVLSLPCDNPDVDWAAIVREGTTLRPQH